MLYPIYIVEKGKEDELPKTGTYGIVTCDGVYLRKDTGLIQATVKLEKGFSGLGKIVPEAKIDLPKIPAKLSAEIITFFHLAYLAHRSEAIILLHYSKELGEYKLVCPEQVVSSAAIHNYDMTERFAGYRLVGTIHSHNTMSAFHSWVDQDDEAHFDGLHVTIGRLDKKNFGQVEISATLAVNNNRFKQFPEDFFEGIEKAPEPKPTVFVKALRLVEDSFVEEELGVESIYASYYSPKLEQNRYVHLLLTNEPHSANIENQKNWLKKIRKPVMPIQKKAPAELTITTPLPASVPAIKKRKAKRVVKKEIKNED